MIYPKACRLSSCSNTVSGADQAQGITYCRQHRSLQSTGSMRASPTARGYNYRWQQLSRQYFRNNPGVICAICGQRYASVLDHKIPLVVLKDTFPAILQSPEQFMDYYQPACRQCNGAKGFGSDREIIRRHLGGV